MGDQRTRIALGLAGAYVLGRYRKTRWLVMIAAALAAPELKKLAEQGKETAAAMLIQQVRGLTDKVHQTTEALRGPGGEADGSPGEDEKAQPDQSAETQSEAEPETESEAEPEAEPAEPAAEAEPAVPTGVSGRPDRARYSNRRR